MFELIIRNLLLLPQYQIYRTQPRRARTRRRQCGGALLSVVRPWNFGSFIRI